MIFRFCSSVALLMATPSTSQALNRQKWTPELIRAGWVLFPNVLIERQAELGLDSIDLNIVLHLAAHWWVPEILPRPSKARMAAAMQISQRTLQRRLASLEQRQLIKRIIRGTSTNSATNSYDLTGLIEAARPIAQRLAKERAKTRGGAKPKLAPPNWMSTNST